MAGLVTGTADVPELVEPDDGVGFPIIIFPHSQAHLCFRRMAGPKRTSGANVSTPTREFQALMKISRMIPSLRWVRSRFIELTAPRLHTLTLPH